MAREKIGRRPKIVVDFDGTITDDVFPDMGNPKEGVIEALQRLNEAGFEIIIHSCRTGTYFKDMLNEDQFERIEDFMQYYNMPFDRIWTPDKPIASAYVDDKAIRYQNNWKDIADGLINAKKNKK